MVLFGDVFMFLNTWRYEVPVLIKVCLGARVTGAIMSPLQKGKFK
jgi:hypothetical protein